MKTFFTGTFLMLALFCRAQQLKFTPLVYVENGAVLKAGESIIYGSFLRKQGFWYGGTLNYAIIRNADTNELFSLELTAYLKAGKAANFCFYIKPGTYDIMFYIYEKGKWYGGLVTRTPVYKNVDYNDNLKAKLDSGLLKKEDLHRFKFTVNPGLTYLGRWNFDVGTVTFCDDKIALDKKMPADFYFLEFDKAATIIPD